MQRSLCEFLGMNPDLEKKLGLSHEQLSELARAIDEEYVVQCLSGIVQQIEEIMAIDPNLEQKRILEVAAEKIVDYLGAKAASIRLFDPDTLNMTSFGAYLLPDEERLTAVPFKDSISGRVVQESKSITVPSILKDSSYKNKSIVERQNVHSLLAVPIRIPTFMGDRKDLLGSIQIYYEEDDRRFKPLEIVLAELLARRVSYVLHKKKILDLQKLNTRKERIVNKVFLKLSKREGIKLKDLFHVLIPELGESLQVQSCALFAVSADQRFVTLQAAYPIEQSYHEMGRSFTIDHHPYFQVLIRGPKRHEDTPFDRIDPSYLLIKNPLQSRLTSPGMRQFVEQYLIHSILLVPLRANEEILYLIMFYATDQRQYFTDEEIELMVFFGREIMKALRMELLDDILHDFKNPAIAIAGLAGRARKLIESRDVENARDKLVSYLDIVVRETIRLQDLAFATTVEGREELVDLSQVAQKRYIINQEAVFQLGRSNVEILPPELEPGLHIRCPLFGLERVLDNLLNNATKAIPEQGGVLGMRTFHEDNMACLEVRNTGVIPADQIEQVRNGDVRGRGLNIIYRFVQANHGEISVSTDSGYTVFTVRLPLASDEVGTGLPATG